MKKICLLSGLACASAFLAAQSQLPRSVVLRPSEPKGFDGGASKPTTTTTTKKKKKKKKTRPTTTTEAKSPLLQQLLEQERERKDSVERDIADLKERDEYVRSNADAGRVPEAVANRMALRMALFGGIPTFGGIGLFVFFYFSATKSDEVFQPTLVAAATTAPWILGLLGIGFGALSASWDEDVEGSTLGIKEFKLNVKRILDGLKRSANDAKLRDSIDD